MCVVLYREPSQCCVVNCVVGRNVYFKAKHGFGAVHIKYIIVRRAWNLLPAEISLPSIHPFQLAVSALSCPSSSPYSSIRRISDLNPLFNCTIFFYNLLFPTFICTFFMRTKHHTPTLAPERAVWSKQTED